MNPMHDIIRDRVRNAAWKGWRELSKSPFGLMLSHSMSTAQNCWPIRRAIYRKLMRGSVSR